MSLGGPYIAGSGIDEGLYGWEWNPTKNGAFQLKIVPSDMQAVCLLARENLELALVSWPTGHDHDNLERP